MPVGATLGVRTLPRRIVQIGRRRRKRAHRARWAPTAELSERIHRGALAARLAVDLVVDPLQLLRGRVAEGVERARARRHQSARRTRLRHVEVALHALGRRVGGGGGDGALLEWRGDRCAGRAADAHERVFHRRDEDLIVEADDVLRRLSLFDAHLSEHLGGRLGLPHVVLDDVAEGDVALVHLAHAVDCSHDELVKVATLQQLRVRVDDSLEGLPHLLTERRGEEQPRAHLLESTLGAIVYGGWVCIKRRATDRADHPSRCCPPPGKGRS